MRLTSLSVTMAISLFLGMASFCQAESGTAQRNYIVEGKSPSVAADCNGTLGHLHVVFEGYDVETVVDAGVSPGLKERFPCLFYMQSGDEGLEWTAPTKITRLYKLCSPARIALEKNGALDVVWADSVSEDTPDVYFARSTDSGKSWTKPVDISNTPGVSSEPALAIGPDNTLHVVWCDTSTGEKNRDVYYSFSKDAGAHWGKDPLLPADNVSKTPGSSSEPTICVDAAGVIQVAWADTSTGARKPDIYYVRDVQGVWSKPEDLSNSPRVSSHPKLASGLKSWLVWSDNGAYITPIDGVKEDKSADIWCARSGQHYFTDMKPIDISKTAGIASEPGIATSGSHVAVVWTDTVSGVDRPDVCLSYSINAGDSFLPAKNISNSKVPSKHPDVAIIGENVCTIWEEIEDGKSVLRSKAVDLSGNGQH